MAETLLGEGRSAEVFDRGTHVLKLYRQHVPRAVPEREALALQVAAGQGLSVPQFLGLIEEQGRVGIAMSKLPGVSLGSMLPGRRADVLKAMALLQVKLHAISGGSLPSQRERLQDRIERGPLPANQKARLVARLAASPIGDSLCHGDFHPFNLILTGPSVEVTTISILDWPDATSGTPAADACRTLLLMTSADPGLAEDWLAAFCAESGNLAEDVLAWQPVIAAARLYEGIVGEEAERLRRWAAEA